MEVKITKKDVIWGYLAQFLNIGAGILLLPFILKLLPTDLLGVWYIFLTISGFVQMLDFGFQPTFSRNVAYIFSGATELKPDGIEHNKQQLDTPNYVLLKSIIQTMRKFYGYISIGVVVFLLSIGTWYIYSQTNHLNDYNNILIAWTIYILSTVLNFFYSYYNALLIGRGFVKEFNQITIISKLIYLTFATIGLLCGYSIIAIAVANLISSIVNRILANSYFYKNNLKTIIQKTTNTNINLFPIIWFNAKKIGIGSIGGFFVQKGNLLFISLFLPLNIVASYGLTQQIVNVIAGVTPLYLSTHLPELYNHRINNNLSEIRRIFGESVFVYFTLYFIGTLLLLLEGNFILELLHSKTYLLSTNVLLLLLIVQFFESNHSMAATLITTGNKVPYVKAALISGACIAVLSPTSLAFSDWGITGVIIITGIVQASYNNWKWSVIVCKELQTNYLALYSNGFISLRAWFFRHLRPSLH